MRRRRACRKPARGDIKTPKGHYPGFDVFKISSQQGHGRVTLMRYIKAFSTVVFCCLLFNTLARADSRAAWERQVPAALKNTQAFEYIEDTPGLTRVLLVGDSISIGYTAAVRAMLKGKANVHRAPDNGGSTLKGMAMISDWLGDNKWDVIHFNWGLHDLRRNSRQATSLQQYEMNLRDLVDRLARTGATLVWATTTPVPDGTLWAEPGEEVNYNAVAKKIMAKQGVCINDLHAAVLPRLRELQRPGDVHFTRQGTELLAQQVGVTILAALKGNCNQR